MKNISEYNDYTYSDSEYKSTQNVYYNVKGSFTKACNDGDLELIKELLKHPGLDAKTVDYELNSAIGEMNVGIIKMLWNYPGVDMTEHGEQVLSMAALNKDYETAKFVVDNTELDLTFGGNTPLLFANHSNSKEIIELLLDDERVMNTFVNDVDFDIMNKVFKTCLINRFGMDSEEELEIALRLI